MSEISREVLAALSKMHGMPCRSVLVSSYGALQLGFGGATDRIIGGKYIKKRFEVELGTYGSKWRYLGNQSLQLSCSSETKDLTSALIDDVLLSMDVTASNVVLRTKRGGTIVVDGDSSLDDTFYLHAGNAWSLFFNPTSGWSTEEGGG